MKRVLTFLLLALPGVAQAGDTPPAERLYQTHCASCHGGDRLGGMGPALLPENLRRLRRAEARKVIEHGRPATQMPAYGKTLNNAQTKALVELIYTPLPQM